MKQKKNAMIKIDDERIDIVLRTIAQIGDEVKKRKTEAEIKKTIRDTVYYNSHYFDEIFQSVTGKTAGKCIKEWVYQYNYVCMLREEKKITQKSMYKGTANFGQNYKRYFGKKHVPQENFDEMGVEVSQENLRIMVDELIKLKKFGFFKECDFVGGQIRVVMNHETLLLFQMGYKTYMIPVDLMKCFDWENLENEDRRIVLILLDYAMQLPQSKRIEIEKDVLIKEMQILEQYDLEHPICVNNHCIFANAPDERFRTIFMENIEKYISYMVFFYPEGAETPEIYREIVGLFSDFENEITIEIISQILEISEEDIKENLWKMTKDGFARIPWNAISC